MVSNKQVSIGFNLLCETFEKLCRYNCIVGLLLIGKVDIISGAALKCYPGFVEHMDVIKK